MSEHPAKILSSGQVRQADAFTVQHEPVSSIDLMERAGNACANWILEHTNRQGCYYVFCGLGNNGGDGLVIARLLRQHGCKVRVFILRYRDITSEDFEANALRFKRLYDQDLQEIDSIEQLENLPADCTIIDAIFGTGLSRPAEGLVSDCIKNINSSGARVISIDLPSGLFADLHTSPQVPVIEAHHTLSFQCPKLAFMFAENGQRVGEWVILDIGLSAAFMEKVDTDTYLLTETYIKRLLKPRSKFSHKGDYGHALLIAGQYGSIGAAVLAAKACLKSGTGLLTVHLPSKGVEIMQVAVPEAMVSPDEHAKVFSNAPDTSKYSIIGTGPGIGTSDTTAKALLNLLKHHQKPMVLDADALNILGANAKNLEQIPPGSILTPHPKEFERLSGKTADHFERHALQLKLSKQYNVYIILKGAHSCLTTPDGASYFNNTGNPGMAKGGSGDVLTGMITGLLVQGYTSFEAACMGMYLHGKAGDLARNEKGEYSMIAGDIIEQLANAFKQVLMHDTDSASSRY